MKFRLITTLWGHRFADLFLRLTVRSLLSDGNIDAFTGRHAAVYSIFTTEDTADYLQRSPLFQQLQRFIDIQVVLFRSGDIDPKSPSSHWVGWRRGAKMAKDNNEIAILIIADMLYPKNTLHHWISLFEQGYRAIWTSTTQVVQESAIREIEERFPPSSAAPISMSNQEVIELAIRHLHPKIVCMFRDSARASRHPEVVFAEVPGEGLAERAIGSHAMCVDPNFFTLSDALSPLDRFEAIAFESPTGVGLEPLLKEADLYARRSPITKDRLSNMGSWLSFFLTPSDLIESRRTYRFAFRESANDAGFRRVSHALGFYACQVRLTGAIYRVSRELHRANCTLAAQLIATAHYAGRLRRHWRAKGAITVFVPDNRAIENWGLQHFDTLLMPGNERLLLAAVFAHMREGQREFCAGEEFAILPNSPLGSLHGPYLRAIALATGTTLDSKRLVKIIAGPFQRDDCTIYVIDRVLLPLAATTEEPRSTLLPNRWDVHPARLFSTIDAAPTPPEPPPAPPPDPPPAPPPQPAVEVERPPEPPVLPVLQTLAPPGRSLVRTGYRALRSLPGGARPAEWIKAMILRSRHRIKAYRAMTLGEGIAAVSGPPPPPAPPAVSRATIRTVPSNELVEQFCDVQRARAVLTLAEVLCFYRSKVAAVTQDLPALEMVEGCVRDAQISEEALATMLKGILDEAPDFAEAWHELGDLHLGKRKYAEAIACFDRCVTSREAITAIGRTSCYVLAATSKAAALEAWGFLDAAAETYRRAIELGGPPGMTNVAYARLLRRLGKPRDAAREFDVAMDSDVTICNVPPMPRDFADLSVLLAARLAQPIARS